MADEPNQTDSVQESEPELKAEEFTSTQNLIQRLSQQFDELTGQMGQYREMLQNVFENDTELSTAKEKTEELRGEIKGRQDKLNESTEVIELKSKIAEINEDIKMVKESLNTHLINYFQMTGSMSVDMPDGDEREFKLTAKLKPRKTKN